MKILLGLSLNRAANGTIPALTKLVLVALAALFVQYSLEIIHQQSGNQTFRVSLGSTAKNETLLILPMVLRESVHLANDHVLSTTTTLSPKFELVVVVQCAI